MRRTFGKIITKLADKDRKIFVIVGDIGYRVFDEFRQKHPNRFINMGICEQSIIGVAAGMALEGYVPISCYPRFDFMLRAMDSLVNHLDKFQVMTENNWKPKVILRTSIGSTNPLNGGVQHTQDYTKQFKEMLTEVEVVMLDKTEDIFTEFKKAYERDGSTLLIEHGDFYNDK